MYASSHVTPSADRQRPAGCRRCPNGPLTAPLLPSPGSTGQDKVSLLKGLTQEIEGEVAGQNRFLDTMGGGLGNAGSALDSTMAALERMSSQGGARFGLCVAGAVVVFFFCLRYAVLTARG